MTIEIINAIESAQDMALTILKKEYAQSLQLPVDVVKIALNLKYKVFKATFNKDNVSGGVKFLEEGGEIYVNEEDAYARQRFTIAHEIGHCVMHRDLMPAKLFERINMFRDPNDHSKQEIEANAFAASLMPAKEVRKNWRRWGSTEILADIFKVSLSVMSFRLYNLHLKGDK